MFWLSTFSIQCALIIFHNMVIAGSTKANHSPLGKQRHDIFLQLVNTGFAGMIGTIINLKTQGY